jgi:hypothetical protein
MNKGRFDQQMLMVRPFVFPINLVTWKPDNHIKDTSWHSEE